MGRRIEQGAASLEILAADDVARLAGTPGMEIGSHGLTHADLAGLPPGELARELAGSRRTLEDVTGRTIRWLAYPFGSFDPAVCASARDAGYEEAFTVWTRRDGPFARLRIPVHTRDRVLRFSLKLSRIYFPLKRWLKW
jgi:peptidoglycan/xylan/chitin deacetylase (PgdA/CDA1 family)